MPSDLFPVSTGHSTKWLCLDEEATPSANLAKSFRSLHIEHVSLGTLVSQEICRRSPLGQVAELAGRRGTSIPAEIQTAVVRRWFMARKPDAGFALFGFPATLLQARIFDEWLDARDETLDAVLAFSPVAATGALADYYRTHGLLITQETGGSSSRL